jgi:hypothetical protein
MKKSVVLISFGIFIGLMIAGIYWQYHYIQMNERYLQAIKLVRLLSR